MNVVAQDGHIKFMGIELNGTITDFQSKLQAKGLTLSSVSSESPSGIRVFDGVFSGEDAQIVVWYNPRSKQVYRAKAVIERKGKDLIQQLQSKMETKLDLKYGTENKYTELVKDDHSHEFNQHSYLTDKGTIDLFIVSDGYSSHADFYLHVDYKDTVNYEKNRLDEMDDLLK
jgi:hypothetical protein